MLDHWTWTKRVVRPSPRAIRSATSTSKPRTCDGSAGSASTKGAPPSASPPLSWKPIRPIRHKYAASDRKSTRLNSSHGYISYAVFCLKKKKNKDEYHTLHH